MKQIKKYRYGLTFIALFLTWFIILKHSNGDGSPLVVGYFSFMLAFASLAVCWLLLFHLKRLWRQYMIEQTDDLD